MSENLSKPSVGLVTRLRDRFHTDPFFAARIRMAIMYFAVTIAIFFLVSAVVGIFIQGSLGSLITTPESRPISEVFHEIQISRRVGRMTTALLMALVSFGLAGFALRPIKRMHEQQKRFIANVSHELKTPLAIMKSSKDMLLRNSEAQTKETLLENVKSNLEEVERMSKIIDFFLFLSDAENREYSFVKREVPLTKTVARIVEMLGHEAEERGISLIFHTDTPDFSVYGNVTALEQLLTNLVKNALEHTLKGGSVMVSLERYEQKCVRLTVADSGTGIFANDLPYIFEPFYRGRSMQAELERSGAGLGLSIVKEIVRLHDAKIDVKSAEGTGTTFTVDFRIYSP